ncbi:MAG TPA: methyl-accepting chemotaxis protein [Deltaproteobacteria bacterium]|nr:methyl-accepting chemotaxis protein [Deltaproteobacteria bacterium]
MERKISTSVMLGLIMGVFIVIMLATVASTFWVAASQDSDGKILNIAGRQRMLTQKMTKEALAIVEGSNSTEALRATAELFDRSLKALIDGDAKMGVPPVSDAELAAQLDKVKGMWDGFKKNIDKFLSGTHDAESVKYLLANNVPLLKEMNKAVGMYERLQKHKVTRLKITLIVFLCISIAVAVAGWLLVMRVIAKPIDSLVEMATGMSGGDFTVRDVHVLTNYEMGLLSDSLNKMRVNLNDMLRRVKDNSDHLASASNELASTSAQIVKGSEHQSSQTDQMATAMEEMSATVIEVAKNSQLAAESAAEAQEIAVKGGDVVNKAVNGMLAVAETVNRSASTVEALGKSSDQIGAIVAVINDIADQTNLLALNAAIEAARAGEQGRGFAVVADEVRKLAEKTTKATKEIADMIKSIQDDTRGAITSMNKGTQQVEEGVQLANDAGEALRQIVSSIQNVTDLVRQIATAAEEQSATTDEISSNVSAVAAIAKETTSGVHQISEASESLRVVAEELRDIVDTFRLEGVESVAVVEHGGYEQPRRLSA